MLVILHKWVFRILRICEVLGMPLGSGYLRVYIINPCILLAFTPNNPWSADSISLF